MKLRKSWMFFVQPKRVFVPRWPKKTLNISFGVFLCFDVNSSLFLVLIGTKPCVCEWWEYRKGVLLTWLYKVTKMCFKFWVERGDFAVEGVFRFLLLGTLMALFFHVVMDFFLVLCCYSELLKKAWRHRAILSLQNSVGPSEAPGCNCR